MCVYFNAMKYMAFRIIKSYHATLPHLNVQLLKFKFMRCPSNDNFVQNLDQATKAAMPSVSYEHHTQCIPNAIKKLNYNIRLPFCFLADEYSVQVPLFCSDVYNTLITIAAEQVTSWYNT